jgi:hypothetical protein
MGFSELANFFFVMDSQGTMHGASPSKQVGSTSGNPPTSSGEMPTQRHAMAPPPFFQGFPPMPNQMPFLFPHSFMPHHPRIGFAPPSHGGVTNPIDLSEGSQKRGSVEFVTDQPKTAKKRRAVKKKSEIVELDDAKEDVELLKNIGPWKDHWVIQLITIRGEMQNTFSAPPKQGIIFSPHHKMVLPSL